MRGIWWKWVVQCDGTTGAEAVELDIWWGLDALFLWCREPQKTLEKGGGWSRAAFSGGGSEHPLVVGQRGAFRRSQGCSLACVTPGVTVYLLPFFF